MVKSKKKPHGNIGKKMSQESRDKISKSHIGLRHKKESIEKMRKGKEYLKGVPKSDYVKEIVSKNNKNKSKSLSTKLSISIATIGVSKNRKPIIVDGVTYYRLKDVALKYNISETAVRYRIKSNGFPNWTRN